MAQWNESPEWTDNINGGNEYTSNDSPTANDFNAIVENILYLYKNIGSGGSLSLFKPNISLNASTTLLSIDGSANGDFLDGYIIYANDTQIADLADTKNSILLEDYISEVGTYTIKVVCYGKGFLTSEPSSVSYTVEELGEAKLYRVTSSDIQMQGMTSDSTGNDSIASASTDSYAFFVADKIYSISQDLTSSEIQSNTHYYIEDSVGARAGNYGCFVGGIDSEMGQYKESAFALTENGTIIDLTGIDLANYAQSSSASTGETAYFMGGENEDGVTKSRYSISSNLTASQEENMYVARRKATSCVNGDFLRTMGGISNSGLASGDTYRIGTGYTSGVFNLAKPRHSAASAAIGNYIILAGGLTTTDNSTPTNSVEVFTNDGTTVSTPESLELPRYGLGAVTMGDFVLFGGGKNATGSLNNIDIYTSNLTKTNVANIIGDPISSQNDAYGLKMGGVCSAVKLGRYGLFGNSANNSYASVYQIIYE